MIQSIQTKYSHFLSLAVVFGLLFFIACEDSGSGPEEPQSEIQSQTITDLQAQSTRDNPEAKHILFSFRTGQTVSIADSASSTWDIGFLGTSIIVNSGASGPGNAGVVKLNVPFDEVTIAPSTGYESDGEELALSGWYTYTGVNEPQHAIFPNENETYVFKTADGNHYVKFEIISYYQGNPDTSTEEFANLATRAASPYYTFNYVIQLEAGLRELE